MAICAVCSVIGGASLFISIKLDKKHRAQKILSVLFISAFSIIGVIAAICVIANVFGVLAWFVK